MEQILWKESLRGKEWRRCEDAGETEKRRSVLTKLGLTVAGRVAKTNERHAKVKRRNVLDDADVLSLILFLILILILIFNMCIPCQSSTILSIIRA